MVLASPAGNICLCSGAEVGQMELPYLGPAQVEDVGLARAVQLGSH